MEGTAHRRAGPGELVAYALPPGFHWLDILDAHLRSGASFLPIDVRLSDAEQRRLIEKARPSMVVTPQEETLFPDAAPIDPDHAWAVVATSGTAGEPRLAQLSRAAVGSAVAASLDMLGASAYDPWVACLTPAHIGGLLVYLRGVVTGSHITVLERFEPGALLAEAPTGAHVALVPQMLERLVRGGADLGGLGEILVGGARVDPHVRDAAVRMGGKIVNTYGSTETCGGVVYDGIPFEHTSVRIDRPKSGADAGVVEILGPTVMDSYRHDPAATGAVFTNDGWLRTGDVGSIGPEGHLRIAGRGDEAIRTGGETVWPLEVETVLETHPKVADVAVTGESDPEWGEHVAAWVVPVRPDNPPTLEELREHCREDLARFKAPRALHVMTTLPRTAGGKVRRSALRKSPQHG